MNAHSLVTMSRKFTNKQMATIIIYLDAEKREIARKRENEKRRNKKI